jgi:hypothetical protein
LARVHTPAAIEALVAALGVVGTRVPAAVALLERAWGKPAQPFTGADGGPVEMIVTGVRRAIDDQEDAPEASVALTH